MPSQNAIKLQTFTSRPKQPTFTRNIDSLSPIINSFTISINGKQQTLLLKRNNLKLIYSFSSNKKGRKQLGSALIGFYASRLVPGLYGLKILLNFLIFGLLSELTREYSFAEVNVLSQLRGELKPDNKDFEKIVEPFLIQIGLGLQCLERSVKYLRWYCVIGQGQNLGFSRQTHRFKAFKIALKPQEPRKSFDFRIILRLKLACQLETSHRNGDQFVLSWAIIARLI